MASEGNPRRQPGGGSEHPFPSTTWEWRRAKIRRPPEARGTAGRKAVRSRWWGLPPWPPRKPVPLTIKARGGAECWYEIHARGRVVRVPGYTALHDLMREVMNAP